MSNNNSLKLAVTLHNGMVIKCHDKYMIVLVNKDCISLRSLNYFKGNRAELDYISGITDKQPQEELFKFSDTTKLACTFDNKPLFIKEIHYKSEIPDGAIINLCGYEYVMVWGETKWKIYSLDKENAKMTYMLSAETQEDLFRDAFKGNALENLRHKNIPLFSV